MQMHRVAAAAVLSAGFCFGSALAADANICADSKLVEIKSIAQLAPGLRAQLGADRSDHTGIADRGGKFNSTDVIVDETPMRRFALAGVGEKCALVALERGGRGYSVELRTYVLAESTWKEVHHKAIRGIPNSVQELITHAGK